jgi:hypothetical protein
MSIIKSLKVLAVLETIPEHIHYQQGGALDITLLGGKKQI